MGCDVKPPNRKPIGSEYVKKKLVETNTSKVIDFHRRETMHRSTVVSEPLREECQMELHNGRNSTRETNKVRW